MEAELISKIVKTGLIFGGTHADLAKILQIIHSNTFKTTLENKKFVLYQNLDGDWKRIPHIDLVRNILFDSLADYIDKSRYSLISPEGNDPEYESKMAKYQDNMKKLLKMQEHIYNATYRNGILKELMPLLYDQTL